MIYLLVEFLILRVMIQYHIIYQRGFATTGGSYACMHSPWIA
jgi:hypothetical protein